MRNYVPRPQAFRPQHQSAEIDVAVATIYCKVKLTAEILTCRLHFIFPCSAGSSHNRPH